MSSPNEYVFPAFEDLPQVNDQPIGCLWGFFDQDGKKDELGTLNLLTPEVVKAAATEIQLGKHVQLDWSLNHLDYPGYGRFQCDHRIKDLRELGVVAFDDELRINTQSSSQWDGLKHWGLQDQALFYNGATVEQIQETPQNGIHNICNRGGIVGRGVLVDWVRWWEHKNPNEVLPSAISTHRIPVSEVEEVLRFQGTECRQGDIFIMRTDFVRWHEEASNDVRIHGTQQNQDLIGLENSMETVRWLYSKHFSAVAGDAHGFEVCPNPPDCCLHEWLLVHWGTPIGELWNLEGLSKACEEANRWSFFFTSAPLHVQGGVATPPSAIAIL
ncbi:hypothetical protein BGW36DRAFT_284683 [Talaromyces proteolyticus]|uniref:Cyclase n=1 Tax=Talaromyces proteolyticus TaxID=1131652 RepID=A0AAD4Q636_9EURO|nr:uncharacterized protein BGW36DRAFT_284683 [Talaromyces proteolyticus]KAH8704967.1 hypothetical protein BGW36DRAFT_284683 [Talaromyces proteolyticus]